MLFRKLMRTAWRYKAQFLSMVLMVAIGVGVFVGFNAEWKTIEVDTADFFRETNYADYRVVRETGFSAAEAARINETAGVTATRFLSVNVDVREKPGKSLALTVSEEYTVSTMTVTAGAPYDAAGDGFWLSDRFAEENGIAIGDPLTLTYRGMEIAGKVVGLCKAGEYLICTADQNQLMPDYSLFGFCYMSPAKLENVMMGMPFYPQIHIKSDLGKAAVEAAVNEALGATTLLLSREEHMVYAESQGEATEGKAMGSILPVLFLLIAVLTMVTTMHRIAANEKTQIGTLKALGFKDRRILAHYTSYGLAIGAVGGAAGVALGFGLAKMIMSPGGMMGTYFDMTCWDIRVPAFVWAALAGMLAFLTLICFLSVKRMLRGTAADALRPYTPKRVRKTLLERTPLWEKFSFGTRWNLRDVSRHKTRSFMTVFGIFGCMVLLVGGLGMKDTMAGFMDIIDNKVSNYQTKIDLTENAPAEAALALASETRGDWQALSSVEYAGEPVALDIYDVTHEKVRFVGEDNGFVTLADEGAYLCLRLADGVSVGDTISFSPYGSSETYEVRVAGFIRSVMSESITMSAAAADKAGIPYTVTAVYTDQTPDEVADSPLIAGKQTKKAIMDTYDSFMEIMNFMVLLLVLAAVILGIIVLYNLGVMSYVERYRELATLKVVGFRDRRIGRILIGQNVWLTVAGAALGLPGGVGVLQWLLTTLAGEYELKLMLGPLTYSVSVLVTFGVSLLVGVFVSAKNKKINMVEALKGAE